MQKAKVKARGAEVKTKEAEGRGQNAKVEKWDWLQGRFSSRRVGSRFTIRSFRRSLDFAFCILPFEFCLLNFDFAFFASVKQSDLRQDAEEVMVEAVLGLDGKKRLPVCGAPALQVLQMTGKRPTVALSMLLGERHQAFAAMFDIAQKRTTRQVRRVPLMRSDEPEDCDAAARCTESSEGPLDLRWRNQEVGKDDGDAGGTGRAYVSVDTVGEGRPTGCREACEEVAKLLKATQVPKEGRGGEGWVILTDGDDAHRILLSQRDVRKAGRKTDGEGELGVARRYGHGGADVEDDLERRFTLGAKSLDPQGVEPPVCVPVNRAWIIARSVLLVVGKLQAARLRTERHRSVAGPRTEAAPNCETEPIELAQEGGSDDGLQGRVMLSDGAAWRHARAVR